MSNCELLKSDFEKFLLFQCENKAINPDDLISSTIHLLHNCVSARCAILQFYGQLLDELSLLHVHDQRLQAIDSSHLLHRLLHYQDPDSPAKPKKSA
jgi:hypothetical protein